MVPFYGYGLLFLPPLALLAWLDIKGKGKINLILLMGPILVFYAASILLGGSLFPYSQLWYSAVVIILILLSINLGAADRIVLALSVLFIPAIMVFGVLAMGYGVMMLDSLGARKRGTLRISGYLDVMDSRGKQKIMFAPYLVAGFLITCAFITTYVLIQPFGIGLNTQANLNKCKTILPGLQSYNLIKFCIAHGFNESLPLKGANQTNLIPLIGNAVYIANGLGK